MILVDANVIVALVDPVDALRPQAIKDLSHLSKSPFLLSESALAESCYLLPDPHLRLKIPGLIQRLKIRPISESPEQIWPVVFEWLGKYSEHRPDWTDAHLIALCEIHPRLRIWTYDKEFQTIWRRLDGTKIPLAIDALR